MKCAAFGGALIIQLIKGRYLGLSKSGCIERCSGAVFVITCAGDRSKYLLSEIEMFGDETWTIEPPEGRTAQNAAWTYIWIPELMEGEPIFDESSGLSKGINLLLLTLSN
jgi:hypothetical protein